MSISLAGLNRAIGQQINDGYLADPFARSPGLLGLMTGLDQIYAKIDQDLPENRRKATLRVTTSNTTEGDGLEFSMSGEPMDAEFVAAETAPADLLISALEEAANDFTGLCPYATIQSPALAIKIAQIEKWANKPGPLMDFTNNKLDQLAKSFVRAINPKLFPADNIAPGLSGGADGAPAENNLMAFAHALATGQTNGATTTSSSFSYCGIEMGTANTDLRAVQYGSYAGDTAYTRRGVKANMLRPLQNRGVKPDLGIVWGAFYDKLVEDAESDTVIGLMEEISFGIEVVKIDGVQYFYEPRLDDLTYKEIYMGDSSSLNFNIHSTMEGDPTNGSFKLREHPQSALFWIAVAAMRVAFVNKYPWKWAIGRRLTVS